MAGARAVLATWLYPDGVVVTALAEAAGVPAWILVQGSDVFHLRTAWRRRLILRAARRAAGLICVSRALTEPLRQAGVETRKLHVAVNGVDTACFHYREPVAAAAELARRGAGGGWPAGPGGKLVLFVGNLVHVKAPDVLLAAAHCWKVGPGAEPFQVVLIGDGPLRPSLEREVRRLGLAPQVTFRGARPQDEVALWMNVADVLCLCSRHEGMPNVVLEALVSGLPVVATEVGGCREVLRGEPLARLVPPDSPEALRRALRELSAEPESRQELAARHAGRYSWHRQAGEILTLLGTAESGGGR